MLLRGRGIFVSESIPVDRETVFNDSAEEQTAESHRQDIQFVMS